MSRMRRNAEAGQPASAGWERARQAAARVKPLARSAGAAAGQRVHRTRAWVAPQVERTGQVLQDSVAPKVSALLSSAAQRLDPAKPRRRRWRGLAGFSMLAAAAGAVAALVRKRRTPDVTSQGADPDAGDVTPAGPASDGQETSPGAGTSGQAGTSPQTALDQPAGTDQETEHNQQPGTSAEATLNQPAAANPDSELRQQPGTSTGTGGNGQRGAAREPV